MPGDGDVVTSGSFDVEQSVELTRGLVRRPGLPPITTGCEQGRGHVLLPGSLVGPEVDHTTRQCRPPTARDPPVDRAWRDPHRLELSSGTPAVLGAGESGGPGIDGPGCAGIRTDGSVGAKDDHRRVPLTSTAGPFRVQERLFPCVCWRPRHQLSSGRR